MSVRLYMSHMCVFAFLVLCSHACLTCLCLLQGLQGFSLSTTASQSASASSGSQSSFSNNSYGLKDNTGKEHIYTTIGLYQVPALFRD